MAALAFEAQHAIDHMFEHAGAGDIAVLGDMTDQEQRGAARLGEADQLLRAGPNLTDRARRAFDQIRMHGLDRIDDEQRGRFALAQSRQDVAHRGGRGELHRRLAKPQPPRAQAHLIRRFLAGNIGDRKAGISEPRRRLQQQRRFADAGVSAQKHRGSGHDPAAKRQIELRDPRADTRGQRYVAIERRQFHPPSAALQIVLLREHRLARFLDEAVPLLAIGALPLPARLNRAAGLADITFLGFGHGGCLTERIGNAIMDMQPIPLAPFPRFP